MKLLTQLISVATIAGQLGAMVWLQADSSSDTADKVITVKAYRASTLVGMKVKNQAHEELGEINELVVDVESGKVMYAALSVGGVVGLGDKLLAIPWAEYKLKHDEEDTYLVLDIAKEKLEAAPGFDEDNWPDVADQKWRNEIDRYYQKTRQPQQNAASKTPNSD